MKHNAAKIIFFGHYKYEAIYKKTLQHVGYKFLTNINFKKNQEQIRKLNPDLGIIACFGSIIPDGILKIPKYGFLNVHPSLLPKYRGPSPVRTALFNGEKITGITIHITTAKIDAGPIIYQESMPIGDADTYVTLENMLFNRGATIMPTLVSQWINSKLKPQEQDETKATYTKKIRSIDGLINLNNPCKTIINQIKAYSPEPGVYTILDQKRLKLKQVEQIELSTMDSKIFAVGQIYDIAGWPTLACSDGFLRLNLVQLEGKKNMTGEDFLRGHKAMVISNFSI